MRLALYEPDIPQNTGTLMRLAACFNLPVDIIEPCGFIFNDQKMRRAGMDYLDIVDYTRHDSWEKFYARRQGRIVLLTTKGSEPYQKFTFRNDDILLLGRESAGVPDFVHQAADARLRIPMRPETRSINVAVSGAIVLGEALRQTGSFDLLT
ncbi:MAG: tRNA (cytidine(34)-2'-O)-methyltransferase [Alphaproteobacteria bacterium]|nr:tRNA (cytidine(34)-2'-O)-methyltransferase [Alphaproteobacteria bacterium]MBQ8347512.1 tRNA (cytidine(34)-2'-O)-methyltransferase [Alphaproteobacteria bacterium]